MTHRVLPDVAPPPDEFLAELRRRNPLLFGVAAVQAALFGAFLAGLATDPQTVGGEPRWLKPAKFAGSIALFTGTLGWLSPRFSAPDRTVRRASIGVAIATVVEITLIAGQAVRGVESHFNTSTLLDTAVYAVMGLTVYAMMALVALLLVRSWRREFDAAPAFAWGIRLGLAVFVLGALEGAAMVKIGAHAAVSGPELAVLGWQLDGAFRVAHFVGLHGLPVLPLVGYLASVGGVRGRVERPVRLVALIGGAHGALLLVTFAHALAPLVS